MTADLKERVITALAKGFKRVEKGWIQGSMALDKDGETISAGRPEACQWCMAGSVADADDAVWSGCVGMMRRAVLYIEGKEKPELEEIGGIAITQWNDEPLRSRDEVLNVYRRALLLASAEIVDEAQPRA